MQRGRLLFCAVLFAAGASAFFAPADGSAVKSQVAAEFPGGRYFVVACGFSHRNNDDPVVFPGKPGRSHNHTYIGNRSVYASTTSASLRGGETSCDQPTDASTYWVPTLFVDREAVEPLVALAYYIKRTSARVVPIPADLKMVAGNQSAKRPQSTTVVAWSCGALGIARRSSTIPACRQDEMLQLRVDFPSCWNGRNLDSADHKSHMAYPTGNRCPLTHSEQLPTLTIILLYPPVPARATLSSGKFGGHADFINGWEQGELDRLVDQIT